MGEIYWMVEKSILLKITCTATHILKLSSRTCLHQLLFFFCILHFVLSMDTFVLSHLEHCDFGRHTSSTMCHVLTVIGLDRCLESACFTTVIPLVTPFRMYAL
jgi:hypothetical protein